jgi:hypothetical protein
MQGAVDDTQFSSHADGYPITMHWQQTKICRFIPFPIFVIIFTVPLNWFGTPPPLFMEKKEIDNRFPGKKGIYRMAKLSA